MRTKHPRNTQRQGFLRGVIAGVCLVCMWCHAAAGQANNTVIDADNIVVVLDASGSMSAGMKGTRDSKMQVAKSALLNVVQQLPAETNLGLLVFSGRNKTSDWVFPLGPVDNEVFTQSLAEIQPKGGTPLGDYIKRGTDRLLEQRQTQSGYGTYRLIIVTDGQANDPELVDRYTPEVLSRGVKVEVIGVAMSADHTLAKRVHAYRRANDPEALNQALVSSIAEVSFNTDDASSEDEFAIIAGLPDGMAEAMLGALRFSGNEPIGQSSTSAADRSSPSHAHGASVPPGVVNQGSGSTGGGLPIGLIFFFIVAFMVFVQIIKASSKRKMRG